MKTKFNPSKRETIIIGITLVAGLFIGWLFFHGAKEGANPSPASLQETVEKKTIWTCSMHPQIRLDHPGKCPICGMELIPLEEHDAGEAAISSDEIRMTDAAMKLAEVQTMVVRKAYPDKKVYLLGKVKPDERNIAELTARFGGRIEKLFVNFTGQQVRKGEKLATIYSPALFTAQKELLEAMKYRKNNPDLYKAARNKLKLWDLSEEQIDQIETNGEVRSHFDVLSPIMGTVTRRNVALGDYVKEGNALFRVIDLTRVWIMFEAYESDLPWISTGDRVDFNIRSLPGKDFHGKVSFIDPVIDPAARIARVRVEFPNPGLMLKPDMFADGIVTSDVAGNKKDLLIPKTAVLWTGKRAVVYVKDPDRTGAVFTYREIVLGPDAGDSYVVGKGLMTGEEIAVNGVFKIDAAAQLAGKSSMMNPSGTGTGTAVDHPAADRSGQDNASPGLNSGQSGTAVIPDRFRKQLQEVYNAYAGLREAFIATDDERVVKNAALVKDALQHTQMGLLTGEAHMLWMSQLGDMNPALSEMQKEGAGIGARRTAFASFNDAFYKSVRTFGLSHGTVYYQYCPMARGEKGAYWLSDIKEIKNPYFGDAMLTCGETRDTLEY